MANTWEYKIVQPGVMLGEQTNVLEQLGNDGWELVDVVTGGGTPLTFYLKRQKAGQVANQTNFSR